MRALQENAHNATRRARVSRSQDGRRRVLCALRVAALAALPALCLAQTYYPFPIDQDNLAGAPDFSYLNHPLQAADRIFVRDGHFYRVGPDLQPNTGDDERVRFLEPTSRSARIFQLPTMPRGLRKGFGGSGSTSCG